MSRQRERVLVACINICWLLLWVTPLCGLRTSLTPWAVPTEPKLTRVTPFLLGQRPVVIVAWVLDSHRRWAIHTQAYWVSPTRSLAEILGGQTSDDSHPFSPSTSRPMCDIGRS